MQRMMSRVKRDDVMVRVKVNYLEDVVQIMFKGDKWNLEFSIVVVQFLGGYIEVLCCLDGLYWVYVEVVDLKNIVGLCIDYVFGDVGD